MSRVITLYELAESAKPRPWALPIPPRYRPTKLTYLPPLRVLGGVDDRADDMIKKDQQSAQRAKKNKIAMRERDKVISDVNMQLAGIDMKYFSK